MEKKQEPTISPCCGAKAWYTHEHGGYCADCGRETWFDKTPRHLRDIVKKK